MELMTYNEILTKLCNDFDELISPKKMARTNSNIIYLVLKAVSKGLELINSICVVLSNKFDPAKCSVEDLVSVAKLVGTEKYQGSGSGLYILVKNTGDSQSTLLTGTYTYHLDDDTAFIFEVFEDTNIAVGDSVSYIAMTPIIGKFPVTAQPVIEVESNRVISPNLSFSCLNNEQLLGTDDESNVAFRKRILEGYDNQDSLVELENQLRNLPYLYDCRIKFNNTLTEVTYDGITIPPFSAVIFYVGAPRSDIARIIANKIVCPTVQLSDSIPVDYESSVFISGKHTFYLTPFRHEDFDIDVIYKINEVYTGDCEAKEKMENALRDYFIIPVHKDYIIEDDIYNILADLNVAGVDILGVNLKVNGVAVDYIEIPVSRLPRLVHVNFDKEGADV
jgi:hypothetical protein